MITRLLGWGKGFVLALLGLALYVVGRPAEAVPAPCDAEQRGRNVKQLALGSATLLLVATFIAVTLWGTLLFYPRWQATTPEPLIHSSQLREMPRLPDEVAADLAARQAEQAQLLHRYGWVDRERGIVRIPIERAIEIVAERGLDGSP